MEPDELTESEEYAPPLPLIKETEEGLRYFEGWIDEEEGKVVFHSGLVGETGEVREVPLTEGLLEAELERTLQEGYTTITVDDLYQFIVQYRYSEDSEVDQLDRCHRLEEVIHEALVWTGNGTLDGHDYDSSVFNIFSFVIDPDAASESVQAALEAAGELEGAVIAFLNVDEAGEEAEYVVIWPESFTGEFSLS